MSKFLQRIVNALDSRPWRLTLVRKDHTFLLGVLKGDRSTGFSGLLDQYPPARPLGDLLRLDGCVTTVPLDALVQTKQIMHHIESSALTIYVSPAVEAFQVVDVPPGFSVQYGWSGSSRCIARQVGLNATYEGSGWFVTDNLGWRVTGFETTDDAWLEKVSISGHDIIAFLQHILPAWWERGLPVTCDLRYSTEPAIGLAIRYVGDDLLDCEITWASPARTLRDILALPDHVLDGTTVRPGLTPKMLGEAVPTTSCAFRLAGQQVPLFLRDVWPRVKPWSTGAVAALGEQHSLLSGTGTLSLIVEPTERKGMSNVHATPVFVCDGVAQSADLVSRQLDKQSEFVRLPGAWVPVKTVRQTGIGPLGRLVDGTPLTPIKLTAIEVLRRGSSKIDGPWGRVDFSALALPDGRSAMETARMHLFFLCRWRIPGGIIGELAVYQSAFLDLLTSLMSRQAGLKVLVVVSKKDMDHLDTGWPQITAARYEGNRKDPQSKTPPPGVILAAPQAIEAIPALTKIRWDLLCILAADSLIKSPNSAFYAKLGPCQRSLTIGLFSSRDFIKRTQSREALSQMFRIPAEDWHNLVWAYGLRNPHEKAPALPPPYEVQSRSHVPQSSVQPTELTVGSQAAARAVPIPGRPVSTGQGSSLRPEWLAPGNMGAHVEVRYSTGDEQFLVDARKVVSRSETYAQFVPFQCYWPTYSSMTREQQRWYFYWRAQVREGHYPDTDLSYIFVHVYELINNVGVQNQREGYERLRLLWLNYRDRFPKLDNYLIDWMADYVTVSWRAVAPLDVYKEALALGAKAGNVDLVLPTYLEQPLCHLPVPVIEALSNYELRRSKFYMEGHRRVLEESIPAAIETVDKRMRDQFGDGIFEFFNPGTTVEIRRQAFQSARYAGSARNISLGSVVPFSQHRPLRDFMTGLIKHAENTLRKQAGYAGKLYGYSLEPEIRAAIEECLGVVRPVEVKVPPRPQVQIDLARVGALTAESDQVRDLLLANRETDTPEAAPPPPLTAPDMDGRRQPAEAAKGLLTDLQSVQTILVRLGSPETGILLALLRSGGQMTSVDLAQAMPDVLLEGGIDVINNLALEHLGDILIADEAEDKVLADDYRDELEHLLLRNLPVDTAAGVSAKASQLPSEWAAFAARLADHELAVLETILNQGEVTTTVRLIAEANATMPDALLDLINQVAVDTIGDIIIDTAAEPPAFEDEDIDMVRQLLAETAAN